MEKWINAHESEIPGVVRMLKWIVQGLRLTLLGLFALALGPLILTAGSFIYFNLSGKIMPDVSLGGVPVGGLSFSEAVEGLDHAWNEGYRVSAIDLHDPARAWVVAPSEFGLRIDPTASAQKAIELIASGGLVDRGFRMLEILREGINLDPVVSFDPHQAQLGFASWEDILFRPARDVETTLTAAGVQVQPAQTGWTLDIPKSISMIAEDPAGMMLDKRIIPFAMQPFDAARTDASGVVDQVESILDGNAHLNAYDPVTDEHFHWAPDRVELTRWLNLTDDGSETAVEVNPAAVLEYVRTVGDELGSERTINYELGRDSLLAQTRGEAGETLIVEYQPTSYRVQPGDQWISLSFKVGMPYWKLQEANPGLARRGLIPGELLVLPARDDMLTLPVIPEKRILIDISEQRMRVYENGELIRENVVSTGIPDSPTLPGIFQVSSHYINAYASIWDLYMPHFMGIYDAVPGLTNGIHGLPMLSSGRRLWADVLGRPASFGCIILDLDAAEELYNWADDGVVVVIEQ